MSWFNGEYRKAKKKYEKDKEDDVAIEDEDDDVKQLKEEIACLKKQAEANVVFLQEMIILLINQPRGPLAGRNVTTLSPKEINRGNIRIEDKSDMSAGPKGKLP